MKYVFIDANQYRHIYSSSEGFSQEIYDLLVRLIGQQEHIQLLVPQQVKDEVERNRFREWPETEKISISRKIDKIKKQIEEIEKKYRDYETRKPLLKNLKKELEKLEKEENSVTKRFINLRSSQNQKIKKLFDKAQVLPESEDIFSSAKIRQAKGNPPYCDKKVKLGDHIIWESLLSYLQQRKSERPKLIFVSNDRVAWGNSSFDPWLENEYKKRTTGQIIYSNRLSDIPDLTAEEQERIRLKEEENLKKNVISDFVSSDSFLDAGSNAKKLLRIKKLLTEEDYQIIIAGAVSNGQIYQSFSTGTPIKNLLTGENNYVVKQVEEIASDLWDQFEKMFKTGLKRQATESANGPIEDIDIDVRDIPF